MKNILYSLYIGDIHPSVKYVGKLKEHQELVKKEKRDYEAFCEKLSPELQDEFMQVLDDYITKIPYEYAETYIEGFKTGAQVMLSVLHE